MPGRMRGSVVAFLVSALPGTAPAQKAPEPPPNWPTNPYWAKDPSPNGPGHKVSNLKELLETCPKERIGIKVNLSRWETGEIGTFEVGDILKFGVCIGDKASRLSLNHKGGDTGGVQKAILQWMDEKGSKALDSQEVGGGCG